MKTKTILIVLLTGLIACKNPKKEVKLSPEIKLELSGFKSSWDATGEQLDQWGNRLRNNTAEIRDLDSTALHGMPANPSKNIKAMADSLESRHAEVSVRLAILADTYEKLQVKWGQRDSLFKQWEENLKTGEITEENARTSLEPFKEFQHVAQTAMAGMEKELSQARQEVVPLAVRLQAAKEKK